ncbi:hypothetical protein C0995_012912, partial [Termitomyces sp. Mi166
PKSCQADISELSSPPDMPRSQTRANTPLSLSSDLFNGAISPGPLKMPRSNAMPLYTAEVTQVLASHAPIIGRGSIGPRQLEEFEYKALHFFSHKNVEEAKRVEKVIYNIDSPEVRAWVKENDVELRKLTFAVFMARLHALVLSSD